MTTSKKSAHHPSAQSSLQAARLKLAREHGANHTAQLYFARWTSGNSRVQMQIASALMPTSQVNWHRKAQQDFQAWLAQGGFAGPAMQAPRPASPSTTAEPPQLCDPNQHVLIE